MQRSTAIRKVIGFIFLMTLLFLSVTLKAQAQEQPLLLAMDKQTDPGRMRITLNLSVLPDFDLENSGQRVDLLLGNLEVAPGLKWLPEDEALVKALLAERHGQLMISFLLRRPPQQVVATSKDNPARILLDIYWEGDPSGRPAVAFNIPDRPGHKAGPQASRFQRRSPWEGRWWEFFQDYRQGWNLRVPLTWTMAPLPRLIEEPNSPLWSLQQHADQNMFLSLQQAAAELTGLTAGQRYLLSLLLAEAELRSGATEAALARLDLLRRINGPEEARVDYLTAYGQALSGQPIVAQLTLQEQLDQLPEEDPLRPFYQLLLAETALAGGRDTDALEYLQKPQLDWPDPLQMVRQLRWADALAGVGRREEALALYRRLRSTAGPADRYLFSLNRAAYSAFQEQDYAFARSLYGRLVELTRDLPAWDLALFALGTAAYEAGDLEWGVIRLEQVTLERPGTEGSDRARLRLADHQVINGTEIGLAEALAEYEQLGDASNYRPVREEGRFKLALGLYLRQEFRASIDLLMDFRRDFASSELRREVDLLLVEQLPLVIERLISEKNDLEAIVLVEQNRELLLDSGLGRAFLRDVATAFDRLGLYARAGRVLLYLFDRTASAAEQEPFYLPLAKSLLKRGEFERASDYAGRYLEDYPQGDDAGALYGVLFDALQKQGRSAEIPQWLERPNRPRSESLELRAARLYWQLEDYQRVIDSLEWVRRQQGTLQVKEMAWLAEAYFQNGQQQQAVTLYGRLFMEPEWAAQARYRTAQMLIRQGKRGAALKLLEETVETEDSSPWVLLAQDLLIQEQR